MYGKRMGRAVGKAGICLAGWILFLILAAELALADPAASSGAAPATSTDLRTELATATDLSGGNPDRVDVTGARSHAGDTLLPTAQPPVLIDGLHGEDTSDFVFPAWSDVMEVCFPKIRECDACMIRLAGETWLIDCGTEKMGASVVSMLEERQVDRIDTLLLTHPHPDHAGGFRTVSDRFQVDRVLISFDEDENDTMKSLIRLCQERDILVEHYFDGDGWRIGEAYLRAYIKSEEKDSVNDRSGLLRLQYRDRVMIFAGDLERKGLKMAGENIPGRELACDILKYPHHGKDPMVHEFWRHLHMRLAIVTSDDRARSGKADMDSKGWPWAATWDGPILLRTDGRTWVAQRIKEEE